MVIVDVFRRRRMVRRDSHVVGVDRRVQHSSHSSE
jgi:hypothetical protein